MEFRFVGSRDYHQASVPGTNVGQIKEARKQVAVDRPGAIVAEETGSVFNAISVDLFLAVESVIGVFCPVHHHQAAVQPRHVVQQGTGVSQYSRAPGKPLQRLVEHERALVFVSVPRVLVELRMFLDHPLGRFERLLDRRLVHHLLHLQISKGVKEVKLFIGHIGVGHDIF